MSIHRSPFTKLAAMATALFCFVSPVSAEETNYSDLSTLNNLRNERQQGWYDYQLPAQQDFQSFRRQQPEPQIRLPEFRLRSRFERMHEEGLGRLRFRGDVNLMLYEREALDGRGGTRFGIGKVRGRPGFVFRHDF